jgi:hypothetical protein
MVKESTVMDKNKPYLAEDGTLVVPFECSDHAYKYWKQEGKPLTEILKELGADQDVWARYTHVPYPDAAEFAAAAQAAAEGESPVEDPPLEESHDGELPVAGAEPGTAA